MFPIVAHTLPLSIMGRELLFKVTKKDLKIEFFRAGGKGGQHQNKTSSACRIRHPESGAVAECREHRHQHQNKMEAWRKLIETPKFKLWLKKKIAHEMLSSDERRRRQLQIEEEVARLMEPENIRTQVKNAGGTWVDVDPEELNDA